MENQKIKIKLTQRQNLGALNFLTGNGLHKALKCKLLL